MTPAEEALVTQLEAFLSLPPTSPIPYVVYIQGVIGKVFVVLHRDEPADRVRDACLAIAEQAASGQLAAGGTGPVGESIFWDVSDALAEVGDKRLARAKRLQYGPGSGYFIEVPAQEIEIGSDFVPERADGAKPVLPYRRQNVTVGPLWLGAFLVTNDVFEAFWSDPARDTYFVGTGAQWIAGDPDLLTEIDQAFTVAARRCFWKEARDNEHVGTAPGSEYSMLEIARVRALRRARVALWQRTQADGRFSRRGSPVVGVTWWEALAFCEWWSATVLPTSGFPIGSRALLPTDWEWEALRRKFYEPADAFADWAVAPSHRYPGYLRIPGMAAAARGGRVKNAMRPLHVGLFTPPNPPGAFDMVGNVWEWTRSRVLGRIYETTDDHADFGQTRWDDGDSMREPEARLPERDTITDTDDLSYRAVRGASFFSIDPQAAWHPAYRLCDPPFSSYFDLGFRIAIYPTQGSSHG